VVRDDSAGIDVTDPGRTLSTSQANALAVALFLAFNLGLRPALLDTLVLDDPLQSLDDVHLLGLVDLLRRVSPHRQMVITTHDASFASLLSRKLRPVSTGRRSVLARITQWDQRGPVVTVEEVLADPSPMKLVSATGTD